MRVLAPLVFFLLFTAPAFVFGEVQKVDYSAPPPKNLAVSLKLPARVVIGDHVEAELMIENTGTTAFEINDLGDTPDFGGWPPEQLTAMQNAWKTFLHVNRALLESGQRVPREGPSITPALIPVSSNSDDFKFSVRLTDGTRWPPWSK